MVKLTWKTFGFWGPSDDEENPDTEPLKGFRKCSWMAKIGDAVLAGLLFVYDHVPFRHFLPIIVLILYTVFGGWLFRHLENNAANSVSTVRNFRNVNETRPISRGIDSRNLSAFDAQKLNYRREMARRLWRLKLDNKPLRVRERMIGSVWEWYDSKLVDYECPTRNEGSKWTMWNSMFYAAQLYTTIGKNIFSYLIF